MKNKSEVYATHGQSNTDTELHKNHTNSSRLSSASDLYEIQD